MKAVNAVEHMATAERRIVWGAGTSRTLRAHWSMHELGLGYERRPIGARNGGNLTPEYTKLNPSQKIPTVQDGDLVVSESAAIVNYLTTRYGAANNMQPPVDPVERSRYDMWCFFCMMELDADTLYIIRRHEDLHAIYGEAPNAVKAAREIFVKQADAAAARLGAGPYAMGDRFTGADILLTTCLSGALRRGIALPKPLSDYLALTTSRAAYQRALEMNKLPAAS
ncbi:MAG: glutathione S-transferase family protein [Pseudomonadota bacterium]